MNTLRQVVTYSLVVLVFGVGCLIGRGWIFWTLGCCALPYAHLKASAYIS